MASNGTAVLAGVEWIEPQPMATTSLRLPADVIDQLRQQARARHLRYTSYVRSILERTARTGIPPEIAGITERLERIERRHQSGPRRQENSLTACAALPAPDQETLGEFNPATRRRCAQWPPCTRTRRRAGARTWNRPTCRRPGAAALKCRLTRSGARACPGSGVVVRTLRARVTPRHPCARISRSTVHLAAWIPCRRRWSRIFSDPYSDSGLRRPFPSGSQIPARTSVSQASRTARRDGGRETRAQRVRGAIFTPCADSARQIGTTPKRSRRASTNSQISAAAGRTPARKKSSPPSGSRPSARAWPPCA
jgi:hypothetical protein